MSRPVRLRLALVGLGGIGQAYLQAARHVDEVRLTHVADVRPDAARAAAAATGAVAVDDPAELVRPDQVDLVLLCTPPVTHEPLALSFLEASIPVMCEKPLAIDSSAGVRMLAAASRTDTLLTMASKFRFVPELQVVRELVESGSLGQVVGFDVSFMSRVDMTRRWNSDPGVSGGGVLIDNGTHAVDVVRHLVGPVESTLAALTTTDPALRVEDTAQLLLRTRAGATGSVVVSWATDRLTDRYLAVYGSDATVEVGWRASRLRRTGGEEESFGEGYDKVSALAANLRNTARAVLGEESLRVPATDALASVAVVEAAYESAATGSWTTVGPGRHGRMAG